MARNKSTVWLGYADEEVQLTKHAALLNSNVNKIGGTADWPCADIQVPACPLCSTARALIVQLYAPLEQSQFHRTLYIFACLNPMCSQLTKSWLCIRTQHLDTASHADIISAITTTNAATKKKQKISWCSGADDWGEECEQMDTAADEQQNEENGNVIAAKNDNSPVRMQQQQQQQPQAVGAACLSLMAASDAEDDDDDESNSLEHDLLYGFGQLDVHAVDDPNANCAGDVAAAAVSGATASICAEIEGAETDVVLVETPKKPERDLIALLKHTSTPAALGPLAKISDVTLKSYFIAVDVEQRQRQTDIENYVGSLSADHIRELYQEYKRLDETAHSPHSGSGSSDNAGAASGKVIDEQESYEKALPAHGDIIFHQFVSTLQQNPGQILRYSRDTFPLLIAPLAEPVPKCPNCNGETICEVQILSTLIPKLLLQQNSKPAPIEYGNVLVFTCLKSCWDTPDKMRYESIIVQAEK